jgi:hypothetical protein
MSGVIKGARLKRANWTAQRRSAFEGKADIHSAESNVRFCLRGKGRPHYSATSRLLLTLSSLRELTAQEASLDPCKNEQLVRSAAFHS